MQGVDMNSITERLNTLFQEWKAYYKEQDREFHEEEFNGDGISRYEEKWTNARPKVLFLLKDTNAYEGDIRDELTDSLKSWSPHGCWAYGFQNTIINYIPPFTEANKEEKKLVAWRSCGVLNLKKSQGGNNSNMIELQKVAMRDIAYITKELEIIQPNIVVCGGTFNIVKNLFGGFNEINGIERCYMRKQRDELWIDFCHPGYRIYHDFMYYTLMVIYQNYLRSRH
jgi:hypothetical protein